MDLLRDRIVSLRRETSDHRLSFVPEGTLEKIVTTEAIQAELRRSRAPLQEEPEIIKLIKQGGIKTFAILVCIYRTDRITNFIENEQLQKVGIDSKLPYISRTELERLGLPEVDATDFFEKQWEFTAPVFRRCAGHRWLYKKIIFPFLESDDLSEGGFGTVYKVKLHESHILADSLEDKAAVRASRLIQRKHLNRVPETLRCMDSHDHTRASPEQWKI